MKKLNFVIIIMTCVLNIYAIQAQNDIQWSSNRPDGHGPISIMGDHTHSKGEWMISYRFMNMTSDGLIQNRSKIAEQKVLEKFMMSPREMEMKMHMFGLMYAVNNKLTLMSMLPIVSKEMTGVNRMGMIMNNSVKGIGDMKASALYNISSKNRLNIIGQLGLSLPTGSIDKQNMNDLILPYGMQLGNGSFGVFTGIVLNKQFDYFSIGFQSKYDFQLSENAQNYKRESVFSASTWFAYKISKFFSISLSGHSTNKGSLKGKDRRMNEMMSPPSNTANYGGSLLIYGLGTNFYIPEVVLKNVRVQVEVLNPIAQNPDGIQLETNAKGIIGIQYSW